MTVSARPEEASARTSPLESTPIEMASMNATEGSESNELTFGYAPIPDA
jgi:hypothetical protein